MTPPSASLTVLLPTYNRAGSLPRAIESVLGQTRGDLELIVSDNASEDDTRAVCESYAQSDPRVRYHRQPFNLGPIGNFNWLLGEVQTDYALMIADDDWLDGDYAELCLALIESDPSLSIVTGATRYFEGDAPPDLVLNTELTDERPGLRVLRYLRNSWSSAAFYGVLRTSALRRSIPIPNVMGADWLFVAAMAYQGKVVTTTATHLNRTRGGTSASFDRIAEVSGLSDRSARLPHLAIAYNQYRDVAFTCPAYERQGPLGRRALGAAAAGAIIAGHPFDVFWDAFGPLILHRRALWLTGPLRDRWRASHPL